MQKHQQWIDNRSYQQHLDCLKKIKQRKNNSAAHKNRSRKHHNLKQSHYDFNEKQNRNSDSFLIIKNNKESFAHQYKNNQHKNTDFNDFQTENQKNDQQIQANKVSRKITQANTSQNFFTQRQTFNKYQNVAQFKPCSNLSLKQQDLLWNNFLLGKRILQTSPVISKRKLDLQYKKHKILLKSRTPRKPMQKNNFRLKKLQQHDSAIYRIADDYRISHGMHKKYMISLNIQSIQIFKYKFSTFQNIILSMKHGSNQTQTEKIKKTKQVSQCIPSSALTNYNFFFSIKKSHIEDDVPIIIQIKNVKSLNVISIGTFSFQFTRDKIVNQQGKLFNFQKFIGIIRFSAHYGRKEQFLSHQS